MTCSQPNWYNIHFCIYIGYHLQGSRQLSPLLEPDDLPLLRTCLVCPFMDCRSPSNWSIWDFCCSRSDSLFWSSSFSAVSSLWVSVALVAGVSDSCSGCSYIQNAFKLLNICIKGNTLRYRLMMPDRAYRHDIEGLKSYLWTIWLLVIILLGSSIKILMQLHLWDC